MTRKGSQVQVLYGPPSEPPDRKGFRPSYPDRRTPCPVCQRFGQQWIEGVRRRGERAETARGALPRTPGTTPREGDCESRGVRESGTPRSTRGPYLLETVRGRRNYGHARRPSRRRVVPPEWAQRGCGDCGRRVRSVPSTLWTYHWRAGGTLGAWSPSSGDDEWKRRVARGRRGSSSTWERWPTLVPKPVAVAEDVPVRHRGRTSRHTPEHAERDGAPVNVNRSPGHFRGRRWRGVGGLHIRCGGPNARSALGARKGRL